MRNCQISAAYTRSVTRTVDIVGRLPNAVFTLTVPTIRAIIGHARVDSQTRGCLLVLCHKFFLASIDFEDAKRVFRGSAATVTHYGARLYAEGNNRAGQCGMGSVKVSDAPRLIRLPPVLQVWGHRDAWFAKTTRGLYVWGMNDYGRLGLGQSRKDCVMRPTLVQTGRRPVTHVAAFDHQTFVKTDRWWGGGQAGFSQLGQGRRRAIQRLAPIPGSEGVWRWKALGFVTFAWTGDGLLAAGHNVFGQCGVGSTDGIIDTLTPVALPDDVKGRVDRVVGGELQAFLLCGTRCFACGTNGGQLSESERPRTPTELPVPVDDIITNRLATVIRSGHTLLNALALPGPALPLPGPITRLILPKVGESGTMVAQLMDGTWVKGRLGDDDEGWVSTLDGARLAGQVVGDAAMNLPRAMGG